MCLAATIALMAKTLASVLHSSPLTFKEFLDHKGFLALYAALNQHSDRMSLELFSALLDVCLDRRKDNNGIDGAPSCSFIVYTEGFQLVIDLLMWCSDTAVQKEVQPDDRF